MTNFESLENLVLSPAFTVALVIVGGGLLLILSREFVLWFAKLNQMNTKLAKIDEKLDEIAVAVAALEQRSEVIPSIQTGPKIVQDNKESQFPIAH